MICQFYCVFDLTYCLFYDIIHILIMLCLIVIIKNFYKTESRYGNKTKY